MPDACRVPKRHNRNKPVTFQIVLTAFVSSDNARHLQHRFDRTLTTSIVPAVTTLSALQEPM